MLLDCNYYLKNHAKELFLTDESLFGSSTYNRTLLRYGLLGKCFHIIKTN